MRQSASTAKLLLVVLALLAVPCESRAQAPRATIPGTVTVFPSSLTFNVAPGESPPAQQITAISVPPGSQYSFTTQYSGEASGWLSLSASSGVTPANLTVTLGSSAATLPVGTYTAIIAFSFGQQFSNVPVFLNVIAPVTTQPIITTFAGTQFVYPNQPLPALKAPMGQITGLAFDASGNLYISDPSNNVILKMDTKGMVTVFAGNGTVGFSGDGGSATSAALHLTQVNPSIDITFASTASGGLAADSAGNVFIADTGNHRIRKISPDGIITTFAGTGQQNFGGDGGPAAGAQFNNPASVAVDLNGIVYIADTGNSRIRKVAGGVIATIAGNGASNLSQNGPAIQTALGYSTSLATDRSGNLYITTRTQSGDSIGKIDPAGNLTLTDVPTGVTCGSLITSLALDSAGNLYYSAYGCGDVFELTAAGVVPQRVAGTGKTPYQGYSGDGGTASSALLYGPSGLAVDSSGNLFIADSGNLAIRRVDTSGMITTVAGTGGFRFGGDGNAATTAYLNGPQGLAVDPAGGMWIADTASNRIRRVSSTGVMSSIAGTGAFNFSGDGGPATAATLEFPHKVAPGPDGSVWIADTNNFRTREIDPQGNIHTALGGGLGIATDASGIAYATDVARIYKIFPNGSASTLVSDLGFANDIFSDAGGNLLVADLSGDIRAVSPTGSETIIAGRSGTGYSGDGGPATQALLNYPAGVAKDTSGNIFIADSGNNRIRIVTPDGTINTLAGTGTASFSGDGGLASQATLNNPNGVATDPRGNLYIADTGNNRIRMVLGAPPVFLDPSPSASGPFLLSAPSGGKPVTSNLYLSSVYSFLSILSISGMPYSISATQTGSWLTVSSNSGLTPALVAVTADPTKLPPGTYSAAITISIPNANPSTRIVNVQFDVGSPIPPNLSMDRQHLSFTYSAASQARTQTITLSNVGGGELTYQTAVTLASGQTAKWLSVTPPSGTATPANPAVLNVQADPTRLQPGLYSGQIAISSSGGSAYVSVTITVTDNRLVMLLSQTGLTFTAVQNGGAVPPQTFSVLNLGSGALNWTAQTSVLGGVNNWLTLGATAGVANSGATSAAPPVVVGVNPAGLQPGVYYGLVTLTSTGAANTPQAVVVALQVLAADSDMAPVVQPSSLIFTAPQSASSPSSQTLQVYDPTGKLKSFRSSINTSGGGNWFVTLPAEATVPVNGPAQIVVQPIVNGLAAATYQGALTLQFSDGRVLQVPIQFAVTAKSGAAGSLSTFRRADSPDPCIPAQLTPLLLTHASGFSVPAGYPQGLEARVVDNCGNPQTDGTVFVQFSNGDAPVRLQSLGNGVWDGTWPAGSNASDVTLTVVAQSAAAIRGQTNVIGGLAVNTPAPVIATDGIVNLAGGKSGMPVAPGELISILGQQLSGGTSQGAGNPLQVVLSGTVVDIGSQTGTSAGQFVALPLLYASTGEVRAGVPFNVSINTNQQILLQWGTAYAAPVYVDVAAASPGIFVNGTQAMLADTSGNPITPANPAHTGDTVQIFCSGLGIVSPSLADGSITPASPPYIPQAVPTVTIGGQNATVTSYSLVPGMTGVYQILVMVPTAATPGDSVPVVITAAGQPSPAAPTSVR
jgi:uncharacterized protein (TIGR03437 family)